VLETQIEGILSKQYWKNEREKVWGDYASRRERGFLLVDLLIDVEEGHREMMPTRERKDPVGILLEERTEKKS